MNNLIKLKITTCKHANKTFSSD